MFDEWTDNASPARFQEMEIDGHLNLVADCFGPELANWNPTGKSMDRSGLKNLEKMNAEQLAAWNAAFEPKNNELRKLNLTGRELVRWKYHRYIRNYLRCIKGVDESVGRITDFLKENGLDEQYDRHLLI